MTRIALGTTGLQVFPLALGGERVRLDRGRGRVLRVLDAIVAAGGNLIDTADIYSRWAPGLLRRRIGDDHRPLAGLERLP